MTVYYFDLFHLPLVEEYYYLWSRVYSHKYRLALKIDEKSQKDENKQKERENTIKNTLGCEFVRINPG